MVAHVTALRVTGVLQYGATSDNGDQDRGWQLSEGTAKGNGMDPRRFEALTRQIATASSRRSAAKVLTGALVAPVLVHLGREEAKAGLPIVHCKPPGKKCDNDQRCCSGRCKKRLCLCNKKGQACWSPLEGALCCSGHCDKGKCR